MEPLLQSGLCVPRINIYYYIREPGPAGARDPSRRGFEIRLWFKSLRGDGGISNFNLFIHFCGTLSGYACATMFPKLKELSSRR